MTSALCPHCDEPVTIPAGADPSALVRCPLCKEEFELSVVLDAMPPSLIVVNGPVPETAAVGIGGERPAFLAAGPDVESDTDEEFRLSDEDDARPATAFAFDSAPGEAGKGAVTATARPKRKQKNALLEVVKVAGGGALGLSIAYIVLWWISPWFGKRPQDPVGVAPTLSKVVPWIVPAQLRGQDPAKDNSGGAGFDPAAAESSVAGVRRSGADAAARNRSGGPQAGGPFARSPATGGGFGEEPPFDALGATGAGASPPGSSDSENASEIDIPAPDIGVPDIGGPGFGAPDIGAPDIGTPAVDVPAVEPDLSAQPPLFEEALVADAPRIAAAELAKRLEAARAARQNWVEAEPDEKAGVAVNGYIVLSELGEAATFAESGKPTKPHRDAAAQLVQSIAEVPEQAQALGSLGAKWISSPSRRNRGVLLLGTVQAVKSEGSLYELRLVMEGAKEPTEISVVSQESPGEQVQEGTRLLVLGAIVTDPALNLTGYAGEEPLVVLRAAHSLVP